MLAPSHSFFISLVFCNHFFIWKMADKIFLLARAAELIVWSCQNFWPFCLIRGFYPRCDKMVRNSGKRKTLFNSAARAFLNFVNLISFLMVFLILLLIAILILNLIFTKQWLWSYYGETMVELWTYYGFWVVEINLFFARLLHGYCTFTVYVLPNLAIELFSCWELKLYAYSTVTL